MFDINNEIHYYQTYRVKRHVLEIWNRPNGRWIRNYIDRINNLKRINQSRMYTIRFGE